MEQTLLLNATYEPITVIDWQRAMTLWVRGRVEIVAEHDREEGALAEVRQKFIIQGGRELIEELARDDAEAPAALTNAPSIFAVPARDDADELVALMLAHVLRTQGRIVEVLPLAEAARTQAQEQLGRAAGGVVVISAVPPSAVTAARQAFRRLRRQATGARFLVGVWDGAVAATELERRLALPEPGRVVTTLNAAATALVPSSAAAKAERSAPPPDRVPETGLRDESGIEEWFDRFIRELAQAFNVPVSLISLIERDPAFWKNHAATLPALAKASEATRDEALCGVVLADDSNLVVVADVTKDRRLAANSVLSERGVRFYAGVALRLRDGHPVGVLCVSDTQPRTPLNAAVRRLREGAGELMALIEARDAPTHPRPAPE